MPLPSLGPISMPRVLGPPPAPPRRLAGIGKRNQFTAVRCATRCRLRRDWNGVGARKEPRSTLTRAPALGARLRATWPGERRRRRGVGGSCGQERGRGCIGRGNTRGPGATRGPDATSDSALAGLLRPTVTPAVRAQVLPTERLLLPKGAFIDCTLETAIDSTLPGMTTCVTATDTFSVDGTVVLLERGTKLVGETRGEVQQGAARVFVLWTEARTPPGRCALGLARDR